MSALTDSFERRVVHAVNNVEELGSTEEAIACLSVIDRERKRLDRMQANPKAYRRSRGSDG